LARERTIKRCYQIVARTPVTFDGPQDEFTHLQQCGAPVTKYGKCARHQDMTHDLIERNWKRFWRKVTR
jgi:hypothetical protein